MYVFKWNIYNIINICEDIIPFKVICPHGDIIRNSQCCTNQNVFHHYRIYSYLRNKIDEQFIVTINDYITTLLH